MWKKISSGQVWQGVICNRTRHGEKYWVNSSIVPFINHNGKPERYLSIRTDITDLKKAEEKLRHMAHHDTLTGLATRLLSSHSIENAILRANRDKHRLAILFIDLDGFKTINDTYGHDIGDQLLISVAERLKESVRESDTVARIGGDEFLILLPEVEIASDVEIVAKKVIKSLTSPFNICNTTCQIGASIGISLYPDHAISCEELIKCADDMMYKIKRSGKNNYAFYEKDTNG
jgi:diguanylate cyclase (GGDEF)-like protein